MENAVYQGWGPTLIFFHLELDAKDLLWLDSLTGFKLGSFFLRWKIKKVTSLSDIFKFVLLGLD